MACKALWPSMRPGSGARTSLCPACYITNHFLQMLYGFAEQKMDRDTDPKVIKQQEHSLQRGEPMSKLDFSCAC